MFTLPCSVILLEISLAVPGFLLVYQEVGIRALNLCENYLRARIRHVNEP